MTEVKGLDPSETKDILLNLQNELARLSLTEKTAESKQAVRTCVYHILLRAITLSKDPTIPVEEIKRLFELAKEIIAESELGDEKELQNRLDDLVNSIVDQADISVQFSRFTIQAQGYFDTISAMLKQKDELLSEDLQNIHNIMEDNKKMLKSMSRRRSVFRTIIVACLAVLILAFTIFSSTVIIVIMLSNSNAEGVTINRSNASIEIIYKERKTPNEMG